MAKAETKEPRHSLAVEIDQRIGGLALGQAQAQGVLEVVQRGVAANERLECDRSGFFDAMMPVVGQEQWGLSGAA